MLGVPSISTVQRPAVVRARTSRRARTLWLSRMCLSMPYMAAVLLMYSRIGPPSAMAWRSVHGLNRKPSVCMSESERMPGIAEQVPGAAHRGALLQDGVALGRAAILQMPGRAHAGDTGAHDDDVKVFSHGGHAINAVLSQSTLCRNSQPCVKCPVVTTASSARAPRGRRSARPSGDDREQAILATAERLLEERSLADISVDDLAKGAGISRPTFYFYFPSKEAVLLSLLEPRDRRCRRGVRGCGAIADSGSGTDVAHRHRSLLHRVRLASCGRPRRSGGAGHQPGDPRPCGRASCRSGSTRPRP